MYKLYNSVYSVIDTEQEQCNYPLPLWGLTAVNLWQKNIGNKYGKIEFYRFINYFYTEEFKTKFFNEFKIYKKIFPEGTIETFKKKEYQQFAYECQDMIELIEKEDWIYWTTVDEFDFYIQQKKYDKIAYILTKDIHFYEINLKALLHFLEVEYKNDYQEIIYIKEKKISEKWYALLYWFELNANGKLPPIDSDGAFNKQELMKEGNKRTGKTGQVFYTSFKDIDVNNPKGLDRIFGNEWKEKIITLSNNDNIIIEYIKKKYNL